jgi:xanthine dehydrogenase YagR molybdenum-binding subunit
MTRPPRIDAPDKVTGRTVYVDDLRPDTPTLIALAVTGRIARGRIARIDSDAAEAVPGVRLIMTHRNAPRLRRILAASMAEIGTIRPLQDDRIRYAGQVVAVIVAETRHAARDAARLLLIEERPDQTPVAARLRDAAQRLKPVRRAGIAPGRLRKGRAQDDLTQSPVTSDARYCCAPHHHNAIEPGAVLARWDADGGVTVHAAVQWHHIDTLAIGQAFGLGPDSGLPGFLARMFLGRARPMRVRLINHPSGGAFGRNLNTIHMLLACMAARLAGQAVKLTLTREQTFTLLSHRGEVSQRLCLGADRDGTLGPIVQEPDVAQGAGGHFVEPVGEVSMQIYAHRSHHLQHRVARLDLPQTGWMRAPGISASIFALESAMDDLAYSLGLDPLEMRLRNHAATNPQSGKPWSSKGLLDCYRQGADLFGWSGRPKGASLRPDGRLRGFGMATAFDLGRQFPASARVGYRPDGTAFAEVTAAEIGQGLHGALATLAAEALGVPRDSVTLATNQSHLAYGAGSIGSTGTFSNAAAIHKAATALKAQISALASRDPASPLRGLPPETMTLTDGVLSGPGNAHEPLTALLSRHPTRDFIRSATTGRTFGAGKQAKASFGAVFTEISLDPLTADLRVERIVGTYACGRIVEPALARGQIIGGIVWGMGQALMEESRIDPRSGRWTNPNLAEALIPTQADTPAIDVEFVGEDDTANHPIGMKGLAEIGVVGPAPAIANAIFDATGQRHRSLPLTIDARIRALETT